MSIISLMTRRFSHAFIDFRDMSQILLGLFTAYRRWQCQNKMLLFLSRDILLSQEL